MVFASQDAWRSHPVISNGVKHMFPGLRKAAIIFGAYLVVDTAWSLASSAGASSSHHGHGEAGGHSKYAFERPEGYGFKPEAAGADGDDE